PGREISITSFTSDYSKILFATTGDKYAAKVYSYDRKGEEILYQYTPQPILEELENTLSPMESVTYPSSDLLDIPAYITFPAGLDPKNLPTVALIHGGPKGPRDYWGFNGLVQFLANRGYVVLQPNIRASVGYGKSFLNAGDKEWGRKMQDDITWGV